MVVLFRTFGPGRFKQGLCLPFGGTRRGPKVRKARLYNLDSVGESSQLEACGVIHEQALGSPLSDFRCPTEILGSKMPVGATQQMDGSLVKAI